MLGDGLGLGLGRGGGVGGGSPVGHQQQKTLTLSNIES